ncbi:MAG: peptide chain release factor 1 [Candidatus Omnitrophica bacterium]|nr:peptide chain release factor 1 [Candidatus Omnitrophota bacterium]
MINFGKFREEYEVLAQELAAEEVFKDRERYVSLSKRFSFLERVLQLVDERERMLREQDQLKKMIADEGEDEEMKTMAKDELPHLEEKAAALEEDLEEMIFQQDEPERDLIFEIRAAAGGDEATLFAGDLFKMYSRYIEGKGWKQEVLSSHETEVGGLKEINFSVKGEGVFSHLKFESGVHRVQRVPATESGGRIHTSTVTVAVLIEPKEIEFRLNQEDLKIETFRASGRGGQHVNVTDSAVRITHLPTHTTVSCQDERSQIKNREKAMRVIKARVLEKKEREEGKKRGDIRRTQIGSGERSEKIRTYNFPERRVTDHRINFTLYRLEAVLEGDLDEIIKKLRKADRRKKYESKGLA